MSKKKSPAAQLPPSHTPGPWKAERLEGDHDLTGDNWAVTGPGNCFIADVNDADDGDNEANARLISAAPDLLAALKMALKDWGYNDNGWQEKATAAIRKAEGGK